MKESRFFWWKMKKILDGPVFFGNKPRDQNYIRDWTCRIMVHIEPSSSRLLFLGRYSKRRHDDEKILQSVSNRVLIRSEATHAKSKRRHCVYVSGQHGYPLCTRAVGWTIKVVRALLVHLSCKRVTICVRAARDDKGTD